MKCDIYSSKTDKLRYIVVSSALEIDSLPEEIRREFDFSTLFKTLYIVEGTPRISLDPAEALENIKKKGYHIQDVTVLFEISTNVC